MSVLEVLEARFEELERDLRVRFKLQDRQDVLDDVFVKSVGKILRLAHTHDPAKSSEYTWMMMIARQVTWQVLKRLAARTGDRSAVDVYMRGVQVAHWTVASSGVGEMWRDLTLVADHGPTPLEVLEAREGEDEGGA